MTLLKNHFFALILLIVTVIGIYFVQNKMLYLQKELTALVEINSKQKIASQKLFRSLYENRKPNELEYIHTTLLENHKILLHKLLYDKESISYADSRIYDLFFGSHGLDKILIDFDIVFHRFIENSLETPSFLLDYGQKLLDKLEITTQIYQSIGEEKISDLLYIENALIILMVFLVLFEAYLIFSPAFTAVYKENLLLKRNQLSLERKIEEEIQKRQEQEAILIQKAKLAEMGEMLNNIAHQWKQPLNVLLLIVGSIKMMNNTHKDTNLSDDIETMSDQIKFMSSTIDTFRSFYQPDRKSVNFSLKEAIRSVQKILQMELKQKRINFKGHD